MKTRLFTTVALVAVAAASLLMPPALPAGPEIPTGRQVYPNPFIDKTTFTLTLPHSAPIRIVVHDLLGRQIRVLREGLQSEGSFEIPWDGSDDSGLSVSPGIYICSLFSENQLVNSVKVVKAAG